METVPLKEPLLEGLSGSRLLNGKAEGIFRYPSLNRLREPRVINS